MVCIEIGEMKMNDAIKIVEITDNEDGSASVQLEMDSDTYHKVFSAGFIHLIENGLKGEEDVRSDV
jgi:hypothetical protein